MGLRWDWIAWDLRGVVRAVDWRWWGTGQRDALCKGDTGFGGGGSGWGCDGVCLSRV